MVVSVSAEMLLTGVVFSAAGAVFSFDDVGKLEITNSLVVEFASAMFLLEFSLLLDACCWSVYSADQLSTNFINYSVILLSSIAPSIIFAFNMAI